MADTFVAQKLMHEEASEVAIDPIQLEIYWSRAVAIANEMMATLIRTSFSTVIRVNRDCSAGIFDEKGQMLAQPDHSAPAHVGCMPGMMQRVLERYPASSIQPGDVFITNDPWIGAGHTSDIYIASAVFEESRLLGFTVTVGHHFDIGGRFGTTDSTDVFEEGLQIPLLKLFLAGERNDSLFRMIEENVRIPHVVLGDLEAQLAANQVGADRLRELAADYDLSGFVDVANAITGITERAMRSRIQALPNGLYRRRKQLEVVDENGEPIVIDVKVHIENDGIFFDYSGSSAQVRRPINCVFNYTLTFSALAIKMALAPEIPYNAGIQRPIMVKAPEGSVVNALRPAPVWRRTVLGMELPDIIFEAIAPIMPDNIIAGNGSCPLWLWLFSGWRPNRRQFAFQTHIMGGLGAGNGSDGLPTVSFPSSVTDTPIEIFENACPIVVAKRKLVTDSGGAGQYRGGLGQEISFAPAPSSLQKLDGPVTIAYSAGRLQSGPGGVDGGHRGGRGRIELSGKPLTRALATIKVSEGDQVTLRVPGGGGFHSPLLRAPDAVLQDVMDGFVSADAAKSVYGVVLIAGDKVSVDERATAALRASLRGASEPHTQRESMAYDS